MHAADPASSGACRGALIPIERHARVTCRWPWRTEARGRMVGASVAIALVLPNDHATHHHMISRLNRSHPLAIDTLSFSLKLSL